MTRRGFDKMRQRLEGAFETLQQRTDRLRRGPQCSCAGVALDPTAFLRECSTCGGARPV